MIFQILFHPSGNRIFWGISVDVIFTILTTITIFLLGYLLNRWNEYRKEEKRLDELEDYFYFLFNQIKNPVKDEINILNELAEDTANKNKIQFTFKDNVNLDVTNLLNIPHSDLHKIFMMKKKGKLEEKANHFSNMINTLNYIWNLKKNIVINLEKFFSDFREYERNWTEAENSILRYYDSFRSYNIRLNFKLSSDEFLYNFDRLIFEWNKFENSKNIYVAFENFIKPLKGICNRFESDERANVIRQFVVSEEFAFNNIDSIKKRYGERFNEDANKLKSKFETFETAINYFKNTK